MRTAPGATAPGAVVWGWSSGGTDSQMRGEDGGVIKEVKRGYAEGEAIGSRFDKWHREHSLHAPMPFSSQLGR